MGFGFLAFIEEIPCGGSTLEPPGLRNLHQYPTVKLAPLPARAQFLNVIESVFAGMSQAIIHNSNYASVDDAKAAIDKYFLKRNLHFQRYPRRAGDKIWGDAGGEQV
jgi:hypothetical protein